MPSGSARISSALLHGEITMASQCRCGTTLTVVCLLVARGAALDNGAADTPPLGWCSWQRYRCARGCNDSTSPNCFNERLIKDTADAMVSSGLKDAGYKLVALDDCWQAQHRVDGHVVADPQLFPSGIKALAAYVHARGLKLGLYTAIGTGTCAMPGHGGVDLGLGCDGDQIPRAPREAGHRGLRVVGYRPHQSRRLLRIRQRS